MWLVYWLTLESIAAPVPKTVPATQPSPGATFKITELKLETPEEFFEQASVAQKKKKNSDAIKLYREFLKKFPAHAQYLNARFQLGLVLFDERKWRDAATEFSAVTEKWGFTDDAFVARLKLASCNIELKKWSEAVLLAQEVLDHTEPGTDFRSEAHWLQARAHFENHNPLEAKKAADRFFTESNGKKLNSLSSAELYRIQIRMKLTDCKAKKLPKILSETDWISQLQNQSLCLFESIPLIKSIAKQDQPPVLNQAVREWAETYETYVSQNKHIPQPKKKIKPAQLKQYRIEMGQYYQTNYEKLKGQITDVVTSWDHELTPEVVAIIGKWRKTL